MNKNEFIDSIIDEITPTVYRKYKRDNVLNTPELDEIAQREIKKKGLQLLQEGDRKKAEILFSYVKQKPRFALFTNKNRGEVYWTSIIFKKHFDCLLYENISLQERMVTFWNEVERQGQH